MLELFFMMCFLSFVHAPEFPIYAEEGSTYYLQCVPDSSLTEGVMNIKYRWVTTGGQPLTNDRYFVGDDGQLEITRVEAQDSGALICEMVFGDTNSGRMEKERFKYVMTVYTLPLLVTHMTINYRINSCEDEYDNNIWREIFNTALIIEVCRDNLCHVKHFEANCIHVQEEVRRLDDPSHELQFNVSVQVSHSTIAPCNLTSTIGKLKDHTQLIIGKLERYTDAGTGQLASYPDLGFEVVRGSLQTQVNMACIGGHGLRGDVCVACEPGTHSPDDTSDCTPCGKGSYQPDYAAIKCKKCPPGHHSFKPGAKDVKQCHNREMVIFIIASIALATVVTGLCFIFVLYKIIKKKVIKSHGVKLPGFDLAMIGPAIGAMGTGMHKGVKSMFAKGVNLLENMHGSEADDEEYDRTYDKKRKKKKKLRFEPKLSVIAEDQEHTPLIADDLPSPRQSAAMLRKVPRHEVDEDLATRPSEALMVIQEEGSVTSLGSTITEIEMMEGGLLSPSGTSRGQKRSGKRSSSDDLAYDTSDHGQKASGRRSKEGDLLSPSGPLKSQKQSGKPSRDDLAYATLDHGEKTKGRRSRKLEIIYESSSSSSSSSSSDSSDSYTYDYDSESTDSTTEIESPRIQPVQRKLSPILSVGKGGSSLFVDSDGTVEHTPIFASSDKISSSSGLRSPPVVQQSHSVLMLHDSSSRGTTGFPTGQVSRTPSEASSRRSFASPLKSPTPSHKSLSQFDMTGVHRSPSVSPSAQLDVRRTLSDVSPRGLASSPRSSAILILKKSPSSTARMAPSSNVLPGPPLPDNATPSTPPPGPPAPTASVPLGPSASDNPSLGPPAPGTNSAAPEIPSSGPPAAGPPAPSPSTALQGPPAPCPVAPSQSSAPPGPSAPPPSPAEPPPSDVAPPPSMPAEPPSAPTGPPSSGPPSAGPPPPSSSASPEPTGRLDDCVTDSVPSNNNSNLRPLPPSKNNSNLRPTPLSKTNSNSRPPPPPTRPPKQPSSTEVSIHQKSITSDHQSSRASGGLSGLSPSSHNVSKVSTIAPLVEANDSAQRPGRAQLGPPSSSSTSCLLNIAPSETVSQCSQSLDPTVSRSCSSPQQTLPVNCLSSRHLTKPPMVETTSLAHSPVRAQPGPPLSTSTSSPSNIAPSRRVPQGSQSLEPTVCSTPQQILPVNCLSSRHLTKPPMKKATAESPKSESKVPPSSGPPTRPSGDAPSEHLLLGPSRSQQTLPSDCLSARSLTKPSLMKATAKRPQRESQVPPSLGPLTKPSDAELQEHLLLGPSPSQQTLPSDCLSTKHLTKPSMKKATAESPKRESRVPPSSGLLTRPSDAEPSENLSLCPSPSQTFGRPPMKETTSDSHQSPGTLALFKDIEMMMCDSHATESPSVSSGGKARDHQQDWFSCMSEMETSPT